MPIRLLRDGILSSERVNLLTEGAELFYRRLMSVVDDFGRYHASPKLLRAACYPLRFDVVTDPQVWAYLLECRRAELLVLYSVGRNAFLQLSDFRQRARARGSKHPAPTDGQPLDTMPTAAAQLTVTCQSHDGQVTDTCQSNARLVECVFDAARHSACALDAAPAVAPTASPDVIVFPLKTNIKPPLLAVGIEGAPKKGGARARKPRGEHDTDETKAARLATWHAYSNAYHTRYHVDPTRNAKANAQVVQFVQRLGAVESPHVAAFYLTHNDQFYVRKGHPLGMLVADAEKLRTEWATDRKITSTRAQQIDRTGTMGDIVAELKAERRQRGES